MLRCALRLHPARADVVAIETFLADGLFDQVGVAVRGTYVSGCELTGHRLAVGDAVIAEGHIEVLDDGLVNVAVEAPHHHEPFVASGRSAGGVVHFKDHQLRLSRRSFRPVVGQRPAGKTGPDDNRVHGFGQVGIRT